ncbi:E1 ubiquitin-activating enzyme [Entamoeba marina]
MAEKIDEGVLNRQLFTIGKEAQMKLMSTRVLISGLNGMGSEIAKNIILMSVKSVGLLDNRKTVITDLGTNFFLKKEDIGSVISEATYKRFQELNNNVPVTVEKRNLDDTSLFKDYEVLVLCELKSKEELIKINTLCRENNVKLVYAINRGVFSMLFNDFGDNFIVHDTNGESPRTFVISEIEGDTIHFVEDDFCDMDVGDEVKFESVQGMTELNFSDNGNKTFKIVKRTPYSVSVGDISKYSKYIKGGSMTEIKPIVTLHYKQFKDVANEPGEISFTNMLKLDKLYGIHGLFHALMIFLDKHGRSPKPHDEQDYELFKAIVEELKVEIDDNYAKIFCYANNGYFSPLDTTIGGIAAQEVLKAASGKYTPYCQFTYYDCAEIIPDKYFELPKEEFIDDSRYAGQVDIIGKTLQKKINDTSVFLIGSGAIGCEILKTWAMMGLATGNGIIHVTDNDNIEKSNLSRQFLFRNTNINQPKSQCAARAILDMNPDVHIKDYQLRVGPATEDIFNKAFYESINLVTTALDNVQARLYCDSQCVKYCLPMIEGGTTGTKGNTQSIIPHITQSYGSTRDPEEKSIPMCTLHNFPNNIHHTIQWARDQFEGIFKNEIEPVKSYKEQGQTFLDSLKKESVIVMLDNLRLINENGVSKVPKTFKDCITWAKEKYDKLFYTIIKKLITNFPEDTLTDEGIPFWHAPKRFPHIFKFDPSNEYASCFIEAASILRAENYGIKPDLTKEEMMKYAETIEINEIEPKKIEDPDDEIAILLEAIKDKEIPTVQPIEFEKDDDTNHHVSFVTSCSNLRAENYCIEPADFLQTKFISGKIIPAMITTTAVVSGLQCIELYKVLLKKPIEAYHCSFLNLAIGYLDGAEPEKVKTKKVCDGFEVTIWDKLEFDGNCTIQQFLDIISDKYPVEVDSITVGSKMFYCSYLPSGASKLPKTFKQIYEEMCGEPFTSDSMTLSVAVCLKSGEELPDDFEFPDILLNF